MRSSNPLSIILENYKLIGPNFIDWLHNLKVILASERILFVLEQSPPGPLPLDAMQEEYDTLKKWKDDDLQARCIKWASMSNEIHRQHEKYTNTKDILLHM